MNKYMERDEALIKCAGCVVVKIIQWSRVKFIAWWNVTVHSRKGRTLYLSSWIT